MNNYTSDNIISQKLMSIFKEVSWYDSDTNQLYTLNATQRVHEKPSLYAPSKLTRIGNQFRKINVSDILNITLTLDGKNFIIALINTIA